MQMYSNTYGKLLQLLLSDKMCSHIKQLRVCLFVCFCCCFVLFAHLRLTYKVINLVTNTISTKEFESHTASASLAGICPVDWLVDGRPNIIRNIWMKHCEALDKYVGFEETMFRHGLSSVRYGTAKAGQRKTN